MAEGAIAQDIATPGGEVSLETPAAPAPVAPAVQEGATPPPAPAQIAPPVDRTPAAPAIQTPEAQAPAAPAVRAPETPAIDPVPVVPAVETPEVQTPAVPTVQTPAVPTVQTPEISVQLPIVPTVQTREIPPAQTPGPRRTPVVDPSVEPVDIATPAPPPAHAVLATGAPQVTASAPAERAIAPPADLGTGAPTLDRPTDLTTVGAIAANALSAGVLQAAAYGSRTGAPAPAMPPAPDLPGLPAAPAGWGGAGAAPQLVIGGLAAILITLVLFPAAGISRRLRLPPALGGPTIFLSLLTRPG